MILGNYPSKLQVNRRLAVPKKIRQTLGNSFIVAKWYEGCLIAVATSTWQELLNRLTGRTQIITSPVRDTDRFIMGSAFEVKVDDQGRIIIPQNLSDYANLKSEVLFLGLGDRVEIWSSEKWSEREKFIAENAANLLEEIAKKNA